jgi:hypothetical protein
LILMNFMHCTGIVLYFIDVWCCIWTDSGNVSLITSFAVKVVLNL